jgi:type IV secretory pathway TrbL component
MQYLRAVPLWAKALLAIALLAAIVAGFKACTATTNHKTDAGLTAARGEGAATAAADGLKGVLQDAETANKAGAAVAAGGRAAYDVCLRTSDTPENCAAPAR